MRFLKALRNTGKEKWMTTDCYYFAISRNIHALLRISHSLQHFLGSRRLVAWLLAYVFYLPSGPSHNIPPPRLAGEAEEGTSWVTVGARSKNRLACHRTKEALGVRRNSCTKFVYFDSCLHSHLKSGFF